MSLPECEVAKIALALRRRVLSGLHVVDPLVRQLPVGRPGPDVEVDVARIIRGDVRVSALDERLDHLQHLRDVAGRPRLVRRRNATENVVSLVQRAFVLVGDGEPVPPLLRALLQDLVVDVGDVGDDRDVESLVDQPSPQNIEDDLLADVADVRRSLHGESAVVDAHPARGYQIQSRHLTRGGVVQAESHAATLTAIERTVMVRALRAVLGPESPFRKVQETFSGRAPLWSSQAITRGHPMNFTSYGYGRGMVVFLIAASITLVAAAGTAWADERNEVRGADRDRVAAAAVKAAGGGTATEVERSDDPGEAYEVEVRIADGTEVDVVLDGSLRALQREDDDMDNDDDGYDDDRDETVSPDNDDNPDVSRMDRADEADDRALTEAERSKATAAAVKAVGSGTATDVEASDDLGTAFEAEVTDRTGTEWDVELSANYRVVSKTQDD